MVSKNEIQGWKKAASILLVLFQYGLIALACFAYGLYRSGTESGRLEHALLGAHMMLPIVAMQVPIVILRWWLKWSVSWGTFAVLAIQGAFGFYLQGIFQAYYYEEIEVHLCIIGIFVSSALALYFMYRHVAHMAEIWKRRGH